MGSAVFVVTQLFRERVCPSQQPLIFCFSKGRYHPVDQGRLVLQVIYSQDLLYDDPKLAHGCEGVADIISRWVRRAIGVECRKDVEVVAGDGKVGRELDRWLREEAGAKPARVSVLSMRFGVARLRLPAVAAPSHVCAVSHFVFVE